MLTTANVLVASGWDVTVLAPHVEDLERFTGVDHSLEDAVDRRIDVVRIPFPLGNLEPDIRRFNAVKANTPRLWDLWCRFTSRFRWPENVYGAWRRPLERAAARIHRRRPVELTIASGGPFVTFAAARHLHRRGVPYVIDHRDAWSLQVFTGERVHDARSRVGRLERAVLDGAEVVWFVNDPIKEWYDLAFPEISAKTRVVMNGYDAVPLSRILPPGRAARDGSVRFGFVGTLTTGQPLDELLAGWGRARQHDDGIAAGSLTFFGYLGYYTTPTWRLAKALEGAQDAGVRYAGPVAKADVADAYQDIDVLVFLAGGDRYVTSGKVFEYMATCRPVVSVTGAANAAKDVLHGYPLWFPASRDPDDVAIALAEAARCVLSGRSTATTVIDRCRAHAEPFERTAQLREAVEGLGKSHLHD
jgi:glycosyltransferase involved in cell wall biosynthesis